jgi:FdrA protein
VLGEGAHADPAGELGPAIAEVRAKRPDLDVAALVVGTDEDPQDLAQQIETLERAGARVFRTVGELVDSAVERLAASEEAPGAPVPLEAIRGPVAAVNVGLESFYDSLLAQGAAAVQVEWKPPAGGDDKLAGILARMKSRS